MMRVGSTHRRILLSDQARLNIGAFGRNMAMFPTYFKSISTFSHGLLLLQLNVMASAAFVVPVMFLILTFLALIVDGLCNSRQLSVVNFSMLFGTLNNLYQKNPYTAIAEITRAILLINNHGVAGLNHV